MLQTFYYFFVQLIFPNLNKCLDPEFQWPKTRKTAKGQKICSHLHTFLSQLSAWKKLCGFKRSAFCIFKTSSVPKETHNDETLRHNCRNRRNHLGLQMSRGKSEGRCRINFYCTTWPLNLWPLWAVWRPQHLRRPQRGVWPRGRSCGGGRRRGYLGQNCTVCICFFHPLRSSSRAGHFRYFFIFSTIKNWFFAFFIKLIGLVVQKSFFLIEKFKNTESAQLCVQQGHFGPPNYN